MILKAGEREAISAWWARNVVLRGFLAGAGIALGGTAFGTLLFLFVLAFIDLN